MNSKYGTIGPIDPDTGRWKGTPAPEVTEEIEAAGQKALVDSILLPWEIQERYLKDEGRLQTREEAEQEIETLGIILGARTEEDAQFRFAVLPKGWTKKRSEHHMWSYILDEYDNEQVAIFFKAAPYDYRAFMRMENED